jgi:hypothetical protein
VPSRQLTNPVLVDSPRSICHGAPPSHCMNILTSPPRHTSGPITSRAAGKRQVPARIVPRTPLTLQLHGRLRRERASTRRTPRAAAASGKSPRSPIRAGQQSVITAQHASLERSTSRYLTGPDHHPLEALFIARLEAMVFTSRLHLLVACIAGPSDSLRSRALALGPSTSEYRLVESVGDYYDTPLRLPR